MLINIEKHDYGIISENNFFIYSKQCSREVKNMEESIIVPGIAGIAQRLFSENIPNENYDFLERIELSPCSHNQY